MAKKDEEVFRPNSMTEGKRNIIQGMPQEYNNESAAGLHHIFVNLSDRIPMDSGNVLN